MTTVVSWNCNMAFRKKYEKILRYDPDIVVVQECENPPKKETGRNSRTGSGLARTNTKVWQCSLETGSVSNPPPRNKIRVATSFP